MSAATAMVDYRTLMSKIEPKVIHSEEQNERYIGVLEDLDSRWDSLTASEREMHELLLLLVQEFEARNYSLHTATPIEALRELMEANGLRQKDLVGVFETASVASAVLNGRRELTKDHIKRLSQKFDVSPELFF
jgi:HTH-type transcriptional regulator/antitoxin HigA